MEDKKADEDIEPKLDEIGKADTEQDLMRKLMIPAGLPLGMNDRKLDYVEDIPERLKPIPYAITLERLEQVIYDRLPNYQFRRAEVQAFACASYLFGGRVKETLQVGVDNVEIRAVDGKEYLFGTLLTEKKKRRKKKVDGKVVGYIKPIPPLRVCPASLEGIEGRIAKTFMLYAQNFDAGETIFSFSRDTDFLLSRKDSSKRNLERERLLAYHYIRHIDFGPLKVKRLTTTGYSEEIMDTFSGYPHYLRHVRLTHLKALYHMDDQLLARYAGWADTRMASVYVHLDGEDIAKAMARRW